MGCSCYWWLRKIFPWKEGAMRRSARQMAIRNIFIIATPLIIHHLVAIIMAAIDTAMTGHISVNAFAAVGVVSKFFSVTVGVIGFSGLVFAGRIYRLRSGAEEEEETEALEGAEITDSAEDVDPEMPEIQELQEGYEYVVSTTPEPLPPMTDREKRIFNFEFHTAAAVAVMQSVLLIALFAVLGKPVLKYIFSFDGDMLLLGHKYLKIMLWYFPFQILLFVYGTVFRLHQKSGKILPISLAGLLLNIILNYMLIFGNLGFPKMGVEGAAAATVISSLFQLVIYIIMSRNMVNYEPDSKLSYKRNIYLYGREMLQYMVPEFFDSGSFVLLAFMAIIARSINPAFDLGIFVIIMQMVAIATLPAYVLSGATGSILAAAGQGGLNKQDKKMIPLIFVGIATAATLVFLILFKIGAWKFIGFFTNDMTLQFQTEKLWNLALIANFFFAFFSIYESSVQAMGREKFTQVLSSGLHFALMGFLIYNINHTDQPVGAYLIGVLIIFLLGGFIEAIRYYDIVQLDQRP